MAIYRILPLALLASFCYAAPVADQKEVGSFISGDLTKELSSLMSSWEKFTPQDIAYLRGVIKNQDSYKSDHEILDKMRREAPETYEKFIALLKPYYKKIKNLNEEAAKFFEEIGKTFAPSLIANDQPSIEQMMNMGFAISAKYQALSADAKANIAEQFPLIAKGMEYVHQMEKSLKGLFDM